MFYLMWKKVIQLFEVVLHLISNARVKMHTHVSNPGKIVNITNNFNMNFLVNNINTMNYTDTMINKVIAYCAMQWTNTTSPSLLPLPGVP